MPHRISTPEFDAEMAELDRLEAEKVKELIASIKRGHLENLRQQPEAQKRYLSSRRKPKDDYHDVAGDITGDITGSNFSRLDFDSSNYDSSSNDTGPSHNDSPNDSFDFGGGDGGGGGATGDF